MTSRDSNTEKILFLANCQQKKVLGFGFQAPPRSRDKQADVGTSSNRKSVVNLEA